LKVIIEQQQKYLVNLTHTIAYFKTE